jgi:DNA (cytosine-5)-methyltransferase 1
MRSIDLFSGPGGLSLGMKSQGAQIVCAVEKNSDACATYSLHTTVADHYNEDIAKIDFRKYRTKCDLVFGGPPCQPFSLGGLNQGRRDKRDMIPEFLRVIEEVAPEAFLMENVPGLTTKKHKAYLEQVLAAFASLGYNLSWAVLNAANYGVPQKRKRLFVVGFRHGQFLFPDPTHGEGKAPCIATKKIVEPVPIGTPPDCAVKYAKFPDLRPSPYAGHIYNGGGRPLDPDGPAHTILASSGGYKTHWVDTLGIAPEYHRHLQAGGKPWEGEVPGARRLSVEECALFQTFPPDMVFSGSRSSQYTQVGDAVPVRLAAALAKAVRRQLNGEVVEHNSLGSHSVQLGFGLAYVEK